MALPPISRLLGQPLTYKTEALLLATPLPAGRLCFALQEETYWVSITGGYLPVGGAGGGGGDVTAFPSPLEAGRIMIGGGGTNAATSTDPDLTEANLSALLDSHLGQTYGDVTASPSPLEAGRMMVGGGGTNTATSTDPDLTEANLSQLLDDFLGQTPGTGDVIASPAPLELDRVMLGGGSTNTATSTDPDLTGANLSALLDSHLGQTYGDVTASPSPLEAGRMMVGGGGTNAATSTDVDLTEANLSALLDSHLGQTYGDVTASPSPLVLDRVMLGGGTVNTSTSTDIDLTGTNLSQLIDEHLGQTYVIAQSAGVEDRIVRWRLDGTPGQYLISSALTSRDNGDLHHHTQGGFRVSGTLADSSDDLEFLYLHGHAVGTHGTVALGFPATNAVPGSSTNAAYFKVGHSVQLWRWNAGSRTDVNSYGAFTIAHDEGEVAIGKLTVDPTGGATAGVEDAFTMTIPNEPPSVTTSIDGPWTAFPTGIVYTPQQLADEINANFTGVQASVVAGDPNKVVIRGIAGGSTEEIGIIAGTTWDWSSALGLAGGTYTGTDFTVKRPGQAGADLEADIFLQGTTAINGVLDPTGVSLIMQATAPIAAPAAGTRVLWAAPDGSLRVSSNVDEATLLKNVEGAAPVQGDYIPVYADNTGSGLKDNLYWSIDSAAPYALEYRTDQSVVTTGGIFNIMVGSSTQPTVPAGCHATIISNENPTDDALMMLVGARESGLLLGANASLKWSESTAGLAFNSYFEDRLQINQGVWVGAFPNGDPGPESFGAKSIQAVENGSPNPGLGQLLVQNDGVPTDRCAIDMVAGDSGRCSVYFRSSSSPGFGNGSIQYDHAAAEMRFYNSQLRWILHADGGLSAQNAGILPSFGVGTINASGLYDDGVLLTDYVFEAFYEGKPRDEKHADYQMKTLEEELQHTKDHLHLSTMPSRAEWEESGKKSMGELTTRLWETVETQMLYIKTLLDRITVLEEKINS